jgi:hypothetical protein
LISPFCTDSTKSSAPTTSVAAREHRHAHRPPGAVRQGHHAAHHLVGVTWIDTEIERDLDRLVELGDGALLHHAHGVGERIEPIAVNAFADLADALSHLAHR